MFYGKECNYAFSFGNKHDFNVYFIMRENYVLDSRVNHYNDMDSCILWAGYELLMSGDWKLPWESVVIQYPTSEVETIEFKTQDELVEAMWDTFVDVNTVDVLNEKGHMEERIEQNWFCFCKGTDRVDVLRWFDIHHSKGVNWLLYDRDCKDDTTADKKAICYLIENYFYDCEQNGHSDFETWCEDEIDNDTQQQLFVKIKDCVNTIADVLFT